MPSEATNIEKEAAAASTKDATPQPGAKAPSASPTDRPLVLYAYSETPNARANLVFFLAHGLHQSADFVFIMNGESSATSLIPDKSNIRIVQRENDCYDLGAYAEVLTKDDFYKTYQRYILMNASIRGPFLPAWASGCWSDMYLGKITDKVKVRQRLSTFIPCLDTQNLVLAKHMQLHTLT